MSDNAQITAGLGTAIAADDVGTAATVTLTIASPCVVTDTGHTFAAGQPIILTTSGALPTGLTAGTIVYVLSPATNTYNLAATAGGSAINTSGSQSGTQTRTSIILAQRIKNGWGPDGTFNDVDVASGKPMPVQVRSATGLIPIGEPTDAANTATDTTSVTGISVWKQISASIQTLAGAVGSSKVATKAAAADFADGSIATLGLKADAKSTATDTTSVTIMQVIKQISASIQSLVTGTVLAAGSALVGKFGIDQTTPGTTNAVSLAQIGGTTIVNGGVPGSQSVGGTVATNVAITGNPINLGAQAVSSENAAVTTARQVQLVADLVGKLIVLPYANPENFVSGAITTAMTGTTTTSLLAAPAAGLRNYITQITVSNSHATVGTDVIIQDGSGGTTLYTIPAAAVYGGAVITFPTPLRQPTTATAIFCANVTTGASTKVSASGYKGA